MTKYLYIFILLTSFHDLRAAGKERPKFNPKVSRVEVTYKSKLEIDKYEKLYQLGHSHEFFTETYKRLTSNSNDNYILRQFRKALVLSIPIDQFRKKFVSKLKHSFSKSDVNKMNKLLDSFFIKNFFKITLKAQSIIDKDPKALSKFELGNLESKRSKKIISLVHILQNTHTSFRIDNFSRLAAKGFKNQIRAARDRKKMFIIAQDHSGNRYEDSRDQFYKLYHLTFKNLSFSELSEATRVLSNPLLKRFFILKSQSSTLPLFSAYNKFINILYKSIGSSKVSKIATNYNKALIDKKVRKEKKRIPLPEMKIDKSLDMI
jgi:hypothetical protein